MDHTVVDHIRAHIQAGDSLVYNRPSIFKDTLDLRMNQNVQAVIALTLNLGVAIVAVPAVDLVLDMEKVHAEEMVVIQVVPV